MSLGEIGLYSLAYKIAMMLPTVQWPFALYWSSHRQVQLVSGEGGERLFARVCTYLALGLTFVAVLITLFVHPLLHVMVSPGFRSAAKYVPWLTLAYLMRAVGGHFREVFVIKKRPSVDARVSWVGTIMCLTGYAILIPRLGVWGAAYATAGSFAVLALYAFIAAQGLWRVQYEYDRLAENRGERRSAGRAYSIGSSRNRFGCRRDWDCCWLRRSWRSCKRAISGTETRKNTFAGYGSGYRRGVKPQASASERPRG